MIDSFARFLKYFILEFIPVDSLYIFLIGFHSYKSTFFMKSIIFCVVSYFYLRNKTHVNWEKSSITTSIYLLPLIFLIKDGPHKLKWSNSSGSITLVSMMDKWILRLCFPTSHAVHKSHTPGRRRKRRAMPHRDIRSRHTNIYIR